MANRVTSVEVLAIMPKMTAGTDVSAYITAANNLVTKVCDDSGLDSTDLKEIERWLGAHFTTIGYKYISQQAIGEAREEYLGKVGLNLAQTPYGQQALMLDHSGALAKLDKGKGRANFRHLNILS